MEVSAENLIAFFEKHRAVRYLPRLLWRLSVARENDRSFYECFPERSLSFPATQDFIADAIRSNSPRMIARFGNVELNVLINYFVRDIQDPFRKFNRYCNHRNIPFWTYRNSFRLSENAGFFPLENAAIDAYCELMLDCMKDVDLLASWVEGENLFADRFESAHFCQLTDLNPFFADVPWSSALAGKRVLVVHPFVDSIRKQYDQKRDLIFAHPQMLPEFELLTVRAVQSIAGNATGFRTWFDALKHMQDEISAQAFDVAIIGCGAYGFPLASFVKRMGRVAIHMGGATQLLFGIKGRRWEEYSEFSTLFNDAWTRPLSSEVPDNHRKVEGGCYW